ncbi:MAG: sensor histidine kinase, partial [Anaerolineales bacterium]|nr:sensor histidine kinase [Anaerolineales bacterium]
AVRIDLATLEKTLGPELAAPQQARLAEAGGLVDDVLEQVRELSHTLRPAMLDELGLLPTLRWSVSRFSERLGVDARLEAADLDERPAADCETVLYRVIQEALTNIARHAQARHVRVRLARQGDRLTALVEDDGVGFDPQRLAAPEAPALGVMEMRERAARLGGTVTLASAPGRGTRVEIGLPWRPRPAGDLE